MSWTVEIIRGFFVAFGALQTITNFIYLSRKKGLDLARNQHRELPDHTTRKQVRVKTICMFSFGILFWATGLFSYFTHSYYELSFIIVMGAYTLYAMIEALFYRYWRTFGTVIISVLLFLATLFGHV
ncbi:hypothetical protein [Gorillibacterium massiliense]|uniref:hypothetical protein n=1 Tax=Gorillibacterium massiliense TaxID=1280390 RepID=UPI00059379FE|nr:hypothetical protein [Gorillibacterium massiliense]